METTEGTVIKEHEIRLLDIDLLDFHPSNRPLGRNPEKIQQLKSSIEQYGFYSSQPLLVRPIGEKNERYQVIQGEHRCVAARELGFKKLPCAVEEMEDEEALLHLIIGNIQTESHPLEIGLNAREVIFKHSKSGFSIARYSEKIGLSRNTVNEYVNAAEVYQKLSEMTNGRQLITEIGKLLQIYRCPKEDWEWLHDFIMERNLSKTQAQKVSQAVREIEETAPVQALKEIFKTDKIKKKAAQETLEGKRRALEDAKPALETAYRYYSNLDSREVLCSFSKETREIEETTVDLGEEFLGELQKMELLHSKSSVTQAAEKVLQNKKEHSLLYAQQKRDYSYLEEEWAKQSGIDQQTLDKAYYHWLACNSVQETAEYLGLTADKVAECLEICKHRIITREGLAHFSDAGEKGGFEVPLYNVWRQKQRTSATEWRGITDERWVENLLYLYTEPFDTVVDLFAGRGTTAEICKKRARRYWVSDRLPTAEGEVRKWDVLQGLPPLEWEEVKLVYLDPPYWRQAAGKYSSDPQDLSHLSLEDFHGVLEELLTSIGNRMSRGYLALMISPTQIHSPESKYIDHAAEMHKRLDLKLNMRYSVPYGTQQYQAFQVQWAKEHRRCLVLNRELLVWEII